MLRNNKTNSRSPKRIPSSSFSRKKHIAPKVIFCYREHINNNEDAYLDKESKKALVGVLEEESTQATNDSGQVFGWTLDADTSK
jgi:hypothetical protein